MVGVDLSDVVLRVLSDISWSGRGVDVKVQELLDLSDVVLRVLSDSNWSGRGVNGVEDLVVWGVSDSSWSGRGFDGEEEQPKPSGHGCKFCKSDGLHSGKK